MKSIYRAIVGAAAVFAATSAFAWVSGHDTVSANHSPLSPLVLELDAAGEAVMESALKAIGLAETRGQVTARGD